MQIFVDADACPVVRIVEEIAEKYHIRTTLLCDTNHVLNSDYSEVIVVGAGADAVWRRWHLGKVRMRSISLGNGTQTRTLTRC